MDELTANEVDVLVTYGTTADDPQVAENRAGFDRLDPADRDAAQDALVGKGLLVRTGDAEAGSGVSGGGLAVTPLGVEAIELILGKFEV